MMNFNILKMNIYGIRMRFKSKLNDGLIFSWNFSEKLSLCHVKKFVFTKFTKSNI